MCLFPKKNLNTSGIAFHKGVTEFACGCCPECLKKKSNLWALRCSMEAKVSPAIMVTLTYDTYIRQNGEIIGERVSDLKVCKEDVQKFVKRVRRYFDYHYGIQNIKYLICAEYGKRTGRAHYHAILFNTPFNDYIYYKRSKRGNIIYKSPLLTKLWNNGICTVDSISCNSAIARYCTKYCAKDSNRCDDTFMLFSQCIGDKMLLETFNGKSYIIDGQEYAIPKLVWNKLIQKKINKNPKRYINRFLFDISHLQFIDTLKVVKDEYDSIPGKSIELRFYNNYRKRISLYKDCFNLIDIVKDYDYRSIRPTYKYKSYKKQIEKISFPSKDYTSLVAPFEKKEFENYIARKIFSFVKQNDKQFLSYLDYWDKKAELNDKYKKSAYDRLLALPNDKYFAYKQACLQYLLEKDKTCPPPPPRASQKMLSNYNERKQEYIYNSTRKFSKGFSCGNPFLNITCP